MDVLPPLLLALDFHILVLPLDTDFGGGIDEGSQKCRNVHEKSYQKPNYQINPRISKNHQLVIHNFQLRLSLGQKNGKVYPLQYPTSPVWPPYFPHVKIRAGVPGAIPAHLTNRALWIQPFGCKTSWFGGGLMLLWSFHHVKGNLGHLLVDYSYFFVNLHSYDFYILVEWFLFEGAFPKMGESKEQENECSHKKLSYHINPYHTCKPVIEAT